MHSLQMSTHSFLWTIKYDYSYGENQVSTKIQGISSFDPVVCSSGIPYAEKLQVQL